MTIALFGNTLLRAAIQRNLVSFPAQVAAFARRGIGDTQERIVQLYFVRGWSVRSICQRYGMSKVSVQNLLSEWRIRAVAAGHIQEIDPDSLSLMAAEQHAGDGHVIQLARPFPDSQEAPLTGRLMSALKEECSDLGVELTSAQAERMQRALQQIAGNIDRSAGPAVAQSPGRWHDDNVATRVSPGVMRQRTSGLTKHAHSGS